MNEGDCRKCGQSTGLLLVTTTQLVGDYHTVLCPDCLNAFHLYMDKHPLFTALNDAELSFHILTTRTSGDGVDRTEELTMGAQRMRDLKRKLYHVSEAWVTGTEHA